MSTSICHIIGTALAYIEIAFWVIGLLVIGLIALGIFILAIIGTFLSGLGGDYTNSVQSYNTGEICSHDENLYACTHEWRRIHPYDYNPYTGGSNEREDKERGW